MTGYAAAADFSSEHQPSLAEGFAALRQMLAVARDSGQPPRARTAAMEPRTRTGAVAAGSPAVATSTKIRAAAAIATPESAARSRPRPRVGSDGDPPGDDGDGRRPPAEVVGPTEVWRLVERAQAGDVDAFGQIYDRYLDTVFRYVYFRVGSRTLAEDLTQEAFLRALRRINSFTWQGRDLGAWLVTIARNLVADHFKSGRYRLEMSTSEVLDADREDRGPEGSPETAVVSKLTNATLLEAVKRLGAEQQECIVLRFLQGFSVAETARAMGKNEGAIKALQYRAVRALARLLPEGFTR